MKVALRVSCCCWLAITALGVLYLYGGLRTSMYGPVDWPKWPLLIGLVASYGAAFALPFFLAYRMTWRRFGYYSMAWFATATLVIALIEVRAQAEERRFRVECANIPSDSEQVFICRDWPYGSNFLGYDPKTGLFWGGD